MEFRHTNNYCKMDRFLSIVELFSKVMAGDEAALEEWADLLGPLESEREVTGLTEDECRILRILEDCLSIERSRYTAIKEEQNEHRKERYEHCDQHL